VNEGWAVADGSRKNRGKIAEIVRHAGGGRQTDGKTAWTGRVIAWTTAMIAWTTWLCRAADRSTSADDMVIGDGLTG